MLIDNIEFQYYERDIPYTSLDVYRRVGKGSEYKFSFWTSSYLHDHIDEFLVEQDVKEFNLLELTDVLIVAENLKPRDFCAIINVFSMLRDGYPDDSFIAYFNYDESIEFSLFE
jgi:hypothetical protein